MNNKIRFAFLARPDDLTALARIAGACDRSRAAMLRKLIRDADMAQKNSPTAQSLPAHAVGEMNSAPANDEHQQEQRAKHTTPAPN